MSNASDHILTARPLADFYSHGRNSICGRSVRVRRRGLSYEVLEHTRSEKGRKAGVSRNKKKPRFCASYIPGISYGAPAQARSFKGDGSPPGCFAITRGSHRVSWTPSLAHPPTLGGVGRRGPPPPPWPFAAKDKWGRPQPFVAWAELPGPLAPRKGRALPPFGAREMGAQRYLHPFRI